MKFSEAATKVYWNFVTIQSVLYRPEVSGQLAGSLAPLAPNSDAPHRRTLHRIGYHRLQFPLRPRTHVDDAFSHCLEPPVALTSVAVVDHLSVRRIDHQCTCAYVCAYVCACRAAPAGIVCT